MEPLPPQQVPNPQNRPSAEDEQESSSGSASYQAHSVSVTESARQVPDTSAARLNRGIKSYLLYIQGSPESLLGRLLLWSGAATDEAFIKAVIHGESHRLPELVAGLSDKKAVFREAIDYAIRFCHPESIIGLPALLLEEYDDEMQSLCAQHILHSYYKSIHAKSAEHQFQQCCTQVLLNNARDKDSAYEDALNLFAALLPAGLKLDIRQNVCKQHNINFDQLLARSLKLYSGPASSVFPEQATVIEALAGKAGFSPELIRMSYSAQPEEISAWVNRQPDRVDAFKKALECCILTGRPEAILSLLGTFADKPGFSVPSSCFDRIRNCHWDRELSLTGERLCSCFIPYLNAERRHALARRLDTDLGVMISNALSFLNDQETFPELPTLSQKLLEVVLDEKHALPDFYFNLRLDRNLRVAFIQHCDRAKNLNTLAIMEDKLFLHSWIDFSDEQKLMLMTMAREVWLRGQVHHLSEVVPGVFGIEEDIIANAEDNDLYRLVAIRLGLYRDEDGIVSLYQKKRLVNNYSDCALLIPFLPDQLRESEAIDLLAEAPPSTLILQACLTYKPLPQLEHDVAKLLQQLQDHHAGPQGTDVARYYGTYFSHYLKQLHKHDPVRAQKEADSLFRSLKEKKQYGVMGVCVSELNKIGHRIKLSDPELKVELACLKGIGDLFKRWNYYVTTENVIGFVDAHLLFEKMWQEDAPGLLVGLNFIQLNGRSGENGCLDFARSLLSNPREKDRLFCKLPAKNKGLVNALMRDFFNRERLWLDTRNLLARTPSAMITPANENDFGICMIRALLYADTCLSESPHPSLADSGIEAPMKRNLVACCLPFVRDMEDLMTIAPKFPEEAPSRWLPDEPYILKSMPDDRKNRAFQALFDALEQIKKDDRSEDVARRCDLIAGYLENLRVRLTKTELGGLALRKMLQEDISGVATEEVPGVYGVRLDRLKTWHCSALRQTALEQLDLPTKPDI